MKRTWMNGLYYQVGQVKATVAAASSLSFFLGALEFSRCWSRRGRWRSWSSIRRWTATTNRAGGAPQKPNRPSSSAGSQRAGFRRPAPPYSRARGWWIGIAGISNREWNNSGCARGCKADVIISGWRPGLSTLPIYRCRGTQPTPESATTHDPTSWICSASVYES